MTDTTTAAVGGLVATSAESGAAGQTPRARVWSATAGAYLWGRQDAGDGVRDSGESWAFAAVYVLAQILTDGYAGPLQGIHHEWRETGRVLVRISGDRVAAVGWEDPHAVARLVPWVGNAYNLPYWPGIIRTPRQDGEATA